MNISITGFWSTRAGDYSPVKSLKTTVQDFRYFFRLSQDAKDRAKRIIRVLVDGKTAGCIHDWMSQNGREDNYFDIPLEYRTVGVHTLQFKVYEPVSSAADAGAGQCVYASDTFTLEFTE